ncbi:hypothetical protein BDR04DRAFT_1112336 [Suillus decipiens]|nr:hypothetical protein BDR04DRAFT_1112336 [Suillus decipiens]
MITVDPKFQMVEWKMIQKLIQESEDVVDQKLTYEVRKILDYLKGLDIQIFLVGALEGLWSSSEDIVGWISMDPIWINSEFQREAKQIQEFRRVEIEMSQNVVVDENSVEWIQSSVDVEVMYFMKKPSEDRRFEVLEGYRWVLF